MQGFPGGTSGKESSCQYRRCRFDPRVRKIPWRRKWQPTPVLLSGKFHGQRNLSGYSPGGSQKVRQDWETEHIWARCNMKLVSSEIFRHLYLSNLRWALAQILSLPCCVWFQMTPENCLWHPTPRNDSIFHLLSCQCFAYQQLSDGYYNECVHSKCYKAEYNQCSGWSRQHGAYKETGNVPLLSASRNWLETASHRLLYKDLCLPTQDESFPSWCRDACYLATGNFRVIAI